DAARKRDRVAVLPDVLEVAPDPPETFVQRGAHLVDGAAEDREFGRPFGAPRRRPEPVEGAAAQLHSGVRPPDLLQVLAEPAAEIVEEADRDHDLAQPDLEAAELERGA